MCEVLNDFFSSVYTAEDNARIPEATQVFNGDTDQELRDIQFTGSEVLNKINKLRMEKHLVTTVLFQNS